jgi:hypothetical protein
MLVIELAFLGLVFYVCFKLGGGTKDKQKLPETGVRLQQKLQKYRMMGVNKTQMEDIQEELVRRGCLSVPFFTGQKPDPEVAAELEMLLEQTPYVPRDLNAPGEDRTISKSTYSAWLRPKDEYD